VAVFGLAIAVASSLFSASSPREVRSGTVGAPASADAFGDAVDHGSMRGKPLNQPVVAMASTPSGRGYWLVATDGGIFTFGDAHFYGSTGGMRLNQPVVGMASTPSGRGYWLVAADGGIFTFGDAPFYGSTGGMRLNEPVVGMATTPTGRGYWLVARDGGVFTFGDAFFAGATTGRGAAGVAPVQTRRGYFVLTPGGATVPFGAVQAAASAGPSVPGPFVGVAATRDGSGYWAVNRDGAVAAYGTAPPFGSANAAFRNVVGITSTASGLGYWLVTSDGNVLTRASAPAPASSYAFLARDPAGKPLRFDPCTPIRFVVNPEGAPAGAVDEVREAFRRLGSALGATFVDAGLTDERHIRIGSGNRASYQPSRYGQGRWAPILVSWVTAGDEPVLAGNVLGYGGSTSYWNASSDRAFVTGEVVFDRDLGMTRPGFGAGLTRGNLVLHELGHVAGLDHVQERLQTMYPSISSESPDGYSSGDRAGLALLGRSAGCLRMASPVG
jgi:hypothetical protein